MFTVGREPQWEIHICAKCPCCATKKSTTFSLTPFHTPSQEKERSACPNLQTKRRRWRLGQQQPKRGRRLRTSFQCGEAWEYRNVWQFTGTNICYYSRTPINQIKGGKFILNNFFWLIDVLLQSALNTVTQKSTKFNLNIFFRL